MSSNGVSIIISARNEFPQLPLTVTNLMLNMDESGITDYEFIIADNGSTDDTTRFFTHAWANGYAKKDSHQLPKSYMKHWRGMVSDGRIRFCYDPVFSNVGARDKAVKYARYNNVIFADGHIALKSGTIKYMVETLKEFGGVVHVPVAWMGAWSGRAKPGVQYTYRIGEKIWGCVDDKTEILTNNGWRNVDTASKDDLFATVDLKSKEIEFQKASSITIKDFDGDMVRILDKNTDMLLTPDHRTIIEKDGKWSIVPAKEVGNNIIPFKTEGYKQGKFFINEWAVLGWIFTDGNYDLEKRGNNTRNRIRIIQKKEDNCLIIEEDLTFARLEYSKSVRKDGCSIYSISAKDSERIIKRFPNRFFEVGDLLDLDNYCLEILWDRMMRADGSNHYVFYKTDERKADLFQILTVLIGKGSAIKYYGAESFKGNRFGKKGIYRVYAKDNKATCTTEVKTEYYKGKVWCPTVPNGTIIIRRNGKVTPTGQTWNYAMVVDDKPFYIPVSGHCFIAVDKSEYMDLGGYDNHQQIYGGGENYLDTLYWLCGSNVMVDPRGLCYHLSAGRGYSYNMTALIHNMMLTAYTLGGHKWSERLLLTYLNKPGTDKTLIKEIYAQALAEGEEKRQFIAERQIMDLDELLGINKENDCDGSCRGEKYRGRSNHARRLWDFKNDDLHGNHHSFVLVFDDWLGRLTDPEAIEFYKNSQYQDK